MAAPQTSKRPALVQPYGSALGRCAWWAWLSCDDEAMASRLTLLQPPFPPWLDAGWWFLAGAGLGLAVGAATGGLVWLLGAHDEPGILLILGYFALAGAGGLAGRDLRRNETVARFAQRIALLFLHLGFLALFWIGLLDPNVAGDATRTASSSVALTVALIFLLPLLWRATTPMLFDSDYDHSWPTLAGMNSWWLRTVIAVILVLLAFHRGTLWSGLCAGLAVLLFALPRALERATEGLAERLGRWPRARDLAARWPGLRRWATPPPFTLEALLLERPPEPSERALAADYSALRTVEPDDVLAASERLWRRAPRGLQRARAAAWCAVQLWRDPLPEVSYRGYVLLDALANQQPQCLDEAFWQETIPRLANHASAQTQAVELLCARGGGLMGGPPAAWRRIRALDWGGLAAGLSGGPRRSLALHVLAFVESLGSPEALAEWWHDWDSAAERNRLAAGETLDATVASRAEVITARAVSPLRAVPGSAHRLYPLAMRQLAAAAAGQASDGHGQAESGEADAVAAWYESARGFEALPEARQREVFSPYSWWSLWQAVARAAQDGEELARQAERYHSAASPTAGPEA